MRPSGITGRNLAALSALTVLAGGLSLGRLWLRRDYYWAAVADARAAGYTTHDLQLRPGTSLHYARSPDRDRPPLLLIPGQGSRWQDYAPVLPGLARDFHVVAVDVHGHGRSSWNRADYRATTIADDLVRLGRELFSAPFLVAGHSSGGLIAVQMAAAHPAAIAGVLIEDAPFFATEADRVPDTFAGQDNALLADFLTQDEETDYLIHSLPASYIGKMFGGLWPAITGRVIAQRRADPTATPNIWWLGPQINRIWESASHPYDLWWTHDFFLSRTWHEGFDQATALARVKVPTVFLKAPTRHDDNGVLLAALDEEDVARVDTLLPDNRIVRVNSSHDIHVARPGRYLAAMRDLARLTSQLGADE